MIEVVAAPLNREHFDRLIAFARDVLAVCDELGVKPVLSGSLAVFAYTQDCTMEVHDVDLSCSEAYFPQLRQALEARGIRCRITDWHVLQAVRDDLKVEFDATEHWMQGLPEGYVVAKIGELQVRMVSVAGLRELYRRGLVDTAGTSDVKDRQKHQQIRGKLRLLESQ